MQLIAGEWRMMFAKLMALFRQEPSDPFSHYTSDQSPGPFDGLDYAERNARELLHYLCEKGIRRVFVITGTNGLSAQIVEANGEIEPPRDGWLEGYRALIDLTDDAANILLDWCAAQPGLVEFDQSHGRLRRSTINVMKASG